ncbi:MAG: hypothetical protein H0U29_09845 [Acidimicrobiia bacterium]|nr:hypothetical protein [Acidimicrobiia bacterium]
MTALVATSLVSLCVLDASLVGYRAVCGRSAFVDRRSLDRRAMVVGAMGGVGVVVALAAWFSALLLLVDDRGSTVDQLTAAGTRMLAVYAGLAVLTTVALAAFFVAPPRWGSLSMVTILGPLTLLRPAVLVAGAVAAASRDRLAVPVTLSAVVVLVAVAAETVMLERWGEQAAAAYRPLSPTGADVG